MPNEQGQRVITVDLDGTLLEYKGWQGPQQFGSLIPAARDVVNRLKSANCYIIIYTTRLSSNHPAEEMAETKEAIQALLEGEGIAFDEIWDGLGKPISDVMWDDRAVTCDGRYDQAFDKLMQHQPWFKQMEGTLFV